VSEAIEEYERYMADEKGNKPKSSRETARRLRLFFPDLDRDVGTLDSIECAAYYDDLTRRPCRTGKPLAADSHRNMLAEAKTFLSWCVTKKWLPANPLQAVEGRGRRRHGKPQLRIDEARRWLAKAIQLADAGEPGAVAAMVSLLMGLRCSEIIERVVRDVDDGGRCSGSPIRKPRRAAARWRFRSYCGHASIDWCSERRRTIGSLVVTVAIGRGIGCRRSASRQG
jgi:site-specific recombinase XerD